MIIGLHGRKQSGKDTVCKIMQEVHDGKVVRKAFADPLKLSAYRVFKPDATLEEALAWADTIKNVRAVVSVKPKYTFARNGERDPIRPIAVTGREFLQNYGTEAHRDVFGTDFWVDHSLPHWDGMGQVESTVFGTREDFDFVVFTDVRFENEAKRIEEWGGQVWRIQRDSAEIGDGHDSEQPLPDHLVWKTIYNNSSLDDLREQVVAVLDSLKSGRYEGTPNG